VAERQSQSPADAGRRRAETITTSSSGAAVAAAASSSSGSAWIATSMLSQSRTARTVTVTTPEYIYATMSGVDWVVVGGSIWIVWGSRGDHLQVGMH